MFFYARKLQVWQMIAIIGLTIATFSLIFETVTADASQSETMVESER